MEKVFIHVGFPKTGTTFLQNTLFSELHKQGLIHYVNFDRNNWRKLSVLGCTAEYLLTETDCDELRKLLKKGMINVISDESLIGSIWLKYCNFSNNKKNIKRVFPDAKIIFTIRNHVDLLQSLYAQFHHEGGIARFKSLFIYKDVYRGSWQLLDDLHIPVEVISYMNMISRYEVSFGNDNILILPYEKLITDKKTFHNTLYGFIGIQNKVSLKEALEEKKHNKSFTSGQIKFSWLLNRFSASRFNKYGFIPNSIRSKIRLFLQGRFFNRIAGKKFKLSPIEKVKIKALYAKDVAALDEKYNLNLQQELGAYYL